MQIENICISEIKPYENNPRNNDSAVDYVANSIKEFGFKVPIIVDANNVIVAGHTRLKAAEKLGLKELPCIRADDLTDDQIKAFRIADNKVSEFAEWDFAKLEAEIDSINLDMAQFGFDDVQVDDISGDDIDADNYEETDMEPRSKFGDIWQLGEHRLMCGNSAEKKCISRLMNGIVADIVLTDPPYGINADKGFSGERGFNGVGKKIKSRHYDDEWDSTRPSADALMQVIQAGKNAIVFGGNYFADILPVGKHWLVWNKHNTMPTFSDAELAWTNIKRNSVRLYDIEWNGLIGKEKERFHPTQKPVKLFSSIINDYTRTGEVVADFYAGSGTAIIASEQTGRVAYCMEIDPHYVDVIINRWEQLTGKTAVLLQEDA